MQRAGPGPHGRAKLRPELSPPPATSFGSRPQAHPRAPHPAPFLSFLEKVPSCGAQPDTGRTPEVTSLRLGGSKDLNQPSPPVVGRRSLISPRSGSCPVPPSPCCCILQFAPCLYPPEGGQQYAARAEKGIQPRGAEGREGEGSPDTPPSTTPSRGAACALLSAEALVSGSWASRAGRAARVAREGGVNS